jgi:RNA polymerase sigma factor (sigma-70 family)
MLRRALRATVAIRPRDRTQASARGVRRSPQVFLAAFYSPFDPPYSQASEQNTHHTFEALLAPNLPSVRRLGQMRMRTPITRTTCRDQLRASAKFRSWLCSIAMNAARMFFRTSRLTISLHEFPQIDSRDFGPSPLARVEEMERLEWLKAGMDRLSDRNRGTIRLCDLEEMSLTETAEVFELSESSAKSTHFRARQRLACALRSMERRARAGQ